jgi:hypothetical protein
MLIVLLIMLVLALVAYFVLERRDERRRDFFRRRSGRRSSGKEYIEKVKAENEARSRQQEEAFKYKEGLKKNPLDRFYAVIIYEKQKSFDSHHPRWLGLSPES